MAKSTTFGIIGILLFTKGLWAEAYTCPDIAVFNECANGLWRISVLIKSMHWELMGEDVNGQPCELGDETQNIRWNYAFSFARTGLVGCNYTFLNKRDEEIGPIQVRSHELHPSGQSWESGDYPGYRVCRTSQQSCLFVQS